MLKTKRTQERHLNKLAKKYPPLCLSAGFYSAVVVKCYDADTFTIIFQDQYNNNWEENAFVFSNTKANVRLLGVDSAERKRKKGTYTNTLLSLSRYDECLAARLLLPGFDIISNKLEDYKKDLIFEVVKQKDGTTTDKYGRILVKVYVSVTLLGDGVCDLFELDDVKVDLFVKDEDGMINEGCESVATLILEEREFYGRFVLLSDILVKGGFCLDYDGGTKDGHINTLIPGDIRSDVEGVISNCWDVIKSRKSSDEEVERVRGEVKMIKEKLLEGERVGRVLDLLDDLCI